MYNVHMNKLKILFEIRFVKLLNFDILLKPDWDFGPDPGTDLTCLYVSGLIEQQLTCLLFKVALSYLPTERGLQ